MVPAKHWISAILATAVTLMPTLASAGVVVSASGPSAGQFPVGRKIGNSERIVLRAGDMLTVLDGRGTRVLRGAGTYSLNQQAGPAKTDAFTMLTERRSARRTALAASRGDELSLSPTSLWYVDLTRPGKTCLADTQRVRLWRGAAEGEARYVISGAGGTAQTVEFSDGSILASWDQQALPLAANTEYRVSLEGGEPRVLSFVVLADAADEPEALAEQLIANDCTRQLDLLTAATMIED